MDSDFSRVIKSLRLKGGADTDTDTDSDSSKPDDKSVKQRRPSSEAKYALKVGCIKVDKKQDDDKGKVEFNARVCKEPKMRFSFFDPEVKYALIVKAALRYVNPYFSMKHVTDVVITTGKKKLKMLGDKLSENVNVENLGTIDEIEINLK